MWQQLLDQLVQGDAKALARSISFVENEQFGYRELMQSLPTNNEVKIIGITGAPGAGKSTLVDGLIKEFVDREKKVAVLCVDPSSPFNLGAVLGDRIRMSDWYTHPLVYIRSLATRGSLGGLHSKILEITDLLKAAKFDYVIVETVGVGQSEIEIVGLADTTVVIVVPEGGDEVQTMKAGLMEIADIFVVNKADRPDADIFVSNLRLMLAPAFHTHKNEVGIIKTIASQQKGIGELFQNIIDHQQQNVANNKRYWLLAEKAFYLIQKEKMKDISKMQLKSEIEKEAMAGDFNLYQFLEKYSNHA
jgi:LAO/AO transport system kinase